MPTISNSRGPVKSCVLISVQFFELVSKIITSFKINIINSIHISKKNQTKFNKTHIRVRCISSKTYLHFLGKFLFFPPTDFKSHVLKNPCLNFFSFKDIYP